jgi:dissimilatory sulfite reductase (desulfoviridin) alpha/beta subunit
MSLAVPRERIEAHKAQAMMAEKCMSQFSVRLSVTGGCLEAEQLRVIAALAERFGDGSVHLTTRQGVESVSVRRLIALD